MKYQKLIKKVLLFLIISSIVSHTVYVFVSIYQYGKKNEQIRADAVIVLGAGVDDDKPSPVFQERINHGIWLYQNGFAGKLIFTGGRSDEDRLSEAAAAKAAALDQGVPEVDIFIEEQSNITQYNLQNAHQIMIENSLSTALLVSDPLHMKRSMMIGEDLGLTLFTSTTQTTRYITWKKKIPLLCREVFFYMGYEVYSIIKQLGS